MTTPTTTFPSYYLHFTKSRTTVTAGVRLNTLVSLLFVFKMYFSLIKMGVRNFLLSFYRPNRKILCENTASVVSRYDFHCCLRH